MSKINVYITLDVDPDFRNFKWENVKKGIERCIVIFKELSLEEKITWFVNNSDLKFTSKRKAYLSKMSIGEIGLHLHLNRPPWSYSYCCLPERNKIYSAIKSEKEKLEKWMEKNTKKKILSFRSGDLLTNNVLFEVLDQLGIKIDSSIPSQFDWSFKEIARKILNYSPLAKAIISKFSRYKHIYKTLPIGIKPFMIGNILEMPVHVYVGGENIKFGVEKIKKRTQKQIERGVRDLVIYWHPHEVVKKEKIYFKYMMFIAEKKFRFKTFGDIIGDSNI